MVLDPRPFIRRDSQSAFRELLFTILMSALALGVRSPGRSRGKQLFQPTAAFLGQFKPFPIRLELRNPLIQTSKVIDLVMQFVHFRDNHDTEDDQRGEGQDDEGRETCSHEDKKPPGVGGYFEVLFLHPAFFP